MDTETPEYQPPRESGERMVEALRISTVFDDAEMLEKIANVLLAKGSISGFKIEPIKAGYIYRGEHIAQDQFMLSILIENRATEDIREMIRQEMMETVGQKWDVPLIEEEVVRVNENMFGFIKRAEIEHTKFVHERRRKLGFALAALISISGVITAFTKIYIEGRERKAVATERLKAYDDLNRTRQKIEQKVKEIELRIARGETLTESATDMGVNVGFDETGEIVTVLREAEHDLKKVIENQ